MLCTDTVMDIWNTSATREMVLCSLNMVTLMCRNLLRVLIGHKDEPNAVIIAAAVLSRRRYVSHVSPGNMRMISVYGKKKKKITPRTRILFTWNKFRNRDFRQKLTTHTIFTDGENISFHNIIITCDNHRITVTTSSLTVNLKIVKLQLTQCHTRCRHRRRRSRAL